MRKIDLRLFASLIWFLWRNAPHRQKHLLVALALVAGLSRNSLMTLINAAAGSSSAEALRIWLLPFLVALAVFIGSSYTYQVMTTVVTTEVINRVRAGFFNKIMDVQPTLIATYERGTLYHIMTTDVAIVAGTTNTFLTLLPISIFLLIGIPQLFFYSTIVGLICILVMAGGVYIYYRQQQNMASLSIDARKHEVEYFESVSGLLDGHRELKLHRARRDDFTGELSSILGKLRTALINASKIYEAGEAGVNVLKFALLCGVVFLVPALYPTEMTVTFSLLTIILFCMNPYEQLVSSYPTFIGSLVSYLRIEDLEKRLRAAGNEETLARNAEPFESLVLNGVVAVHENAGGHDFVFGPVDLEIKRGEIVFLIGENGSGKTTFLNLLAGLHSAKSGDMLLNGNPLSSRDMSQYRARVSAIFSQYHVFRTLFGLSHKSDREVSATIIKVNLLGQTGVIGGIFTRMELSSGQKRRLALAVSLLEDRDVLILDEFVADQDASQRAFLFNELLPELKARGKTVILSTHDLAWNHCCDKLVRLEKGRIVSVTRPGNDGIEA